MVDWAILRKVFMQTFSAPSYVTYFSQTVTTKSRSQYFTIVTEIKYERL